MATFAWAQVLLYLHIDKLSLNYKLVDMLLLECFFLVTTNMSNISLEHFKKTLKIPHWFIKGFLSVGMLWPSVVIDCVSA